MWELARPLIEDWMREHRGPEARVLDEIEGALKALRQLPDLVRGTKRTAELLEKGLRLDPETIAAFAQSHNRQRRSELWPLWAAVAALAATLVWLAGH